MTTFASLSQEYNLPPEEPTPPAIFSVPKKGGGYVYYRSPPGVAPGLGDNWPNPSIRHPNPIGVASVTIGRSLPRGSVRIGEGKDAIGSITPLPGAGGDIPGLDASLGSFVDGEGTGSSLFRILAGVAVGFGIGLFLAGGHDVLQEPRRLAFSGVFRAPCGCGAHLRAVCPSAVRFHFGHNAGHPSGSDACRDSGVFGRSPSGNVRRKAIRVGQVRGAPRGGRCFRCAIARLREAEMRKSLREIRGEYGKAPFHPVNDHARKMREVFQDDDSHVEYKINANWPTKLYELGQGRSVAYTSNKWKENPKDFEDYKHVAESPNVTYVTDEFLDHARDRTDLRPNGSNDEYPMVRPGYEFPPTISELAPFIFFEVRPIESWSEGDRGERKIKLAKDAIQVGIPGCVVYGCYSKRPGGSWGRKADLKPFLAIIHKTHGVMAIVTGRSLDVKKDGIVG